jgi:hypothetical protein
VSALLAPAAPTDTTPGTPVAGRSRSVQELTRTVSASRLTCWQGCRLRFFFRYVAGLEKPPSPARHIGTTVHAVLQQWNLARWRRAPLDADTLHEIFLQAWVTGQEGAPIRWADDEEAQQAAAWTTLEAYFAQTPIPADERPEGVEVGVEADLASHGLPVLVGVLDLVRAGGRIVDFKTTSRTPAPELVSHTTETQAVAYCLLYREGTGRQESAVELHHLVKLKAPKVLVTDLPPATEAQLTRFFRVVESYVRGLEREDFVPSPGMQCSCCEFFNECRRWR